MAPVFDASSRAEEARSELFLNLDSDVSVPLLLKDIHSEKSDASFSKPMAPGKFYKSEHALALLDALRAADFSAKLEIDPAASDAQKEHFERFCSRLRAGELVSSASTRSLIGSLMTSHSLLKWQAKRCLQCVRLIISPLLKICRFLRIFVSLAMACWWQRLPLRTTPPTLLRSNTQMVFAGVLEFVYAVHVVYSHRFPSTYMLFKFVSVTHTHVVTTSSCFDIMNALYLDNQYIANVD